LGNSTGPPTRDSAGSRRRALLFVSPITGAPAQGSLRRARSGRARGSRSVRRLLVLLLGSVLDAGLHGDGVELGNGSRRRH